MADEPKSSLAKTEEARVGGLSDGIFAISMTLLVLELRIPEIADSLSRAEAKAALDQSLLDLIPRLIFFALSFWILGLHWISHQRTLKTIVRYDRGVLNFNLLFLAFVALMPFSTGILNNGNFLEVWWIYCFNMAALGIFLAGLWSYALRKKLTEGSLTPDENRYYLWIKLVAPAVFVLSALVALFNVNIAHFVPWLIVPGFWLLRRRFPHVGDHL